MLLGEKWKFIRNLFGIMHYYFKIQKYFEIKKKYIFLIKFF